MLEDVPQLGHGECAAFEAGGCEVSEGLEWLAQSRVLRDDEVLVVEHLLRDQIPGCLVLVCWGVGDILVLECIATAVQRRNRPLDADTHGVASNKLAHMLHDAVVVGCWSQRSENLDRDEVHIQGCHDLMSLHVSSECNITYPGHIPPTHQKYNLREQNGNKCLPSQWFVSRLRRCQENKAFW